MKKLILPLLAVAALVSLFGCASPEKTSTTTTTEQTTVPGPVTTTTETTRSTK